MVDKCPFCKIPCGNDHCPYTKTEDIPNCIGLIEENKRLKDLLKNLQEYVQDKNTVKGEK